MNEQQRDLMRKALEMRERSLTPAQEARKAEVDARNARIQEVGPRPVDGVTFGTGKAPKEKR